MGKPGEGRSKVQMMSRIGFLLVVGKIMVGRIVVGRIMVGKVMDGTIVVLFISHLPHLLFPHSSAKVEAPDYPITHDP
jgi:hypothetical protein